MAEFWETTFRDEQEMWGGEPADSPVEAVALFKKYGLNKILISGFGYGRNAREINEPIEGMGDKPSQKFWYIICKKEE